jgi:hypothetical protein
LHVDDLGYAAAGQNQHCAKFFISERVTLGRALHFYETSCFVHNNIHVGLSFGIFRVVEIQYRRAVIDADRDRGNLSVQRILFQLAVRGQSLRAPRKHR